MSGQDARLSEDASVPLQVETDQVASSPSAGVANKRRTRLLWTGFGFATLILIEFSAYVLLPLASHASAKSSSLIPEAAFAPMPSLFRPAAEPGVSTAIQAALTKDSSFLHGSSNGNVWWNPDKSARAAPSMSAAVAEPVSKKLVFKPVVAMPRAAPQMLFGQGDDKQVKDVVIEDRPVAVVDSSQITPEVGYENPGKMEVNEIEMLERSAKLDALSAKWRTREMQAEYEDASKIGWVKKAQTINGRLAMFFIFVGLITEYYTGESLPQQTATMLRTLAVID